MFYGNMVFLEAAENQEALKINDSYFEELGSTIDLECANLNKIINSFNILKENQIINEINTEYIKTKIKNLWEKFKTFVKECFRRLMKLVSKFKKFKLVFKAKNSDKQITVTDDFDFDDFDEEDYAEEPFTCVWVTDEFYDSVLEYCTKLGNFLVYVLDLLPNKTDEFDKDKYDKEILSIFDKFGGIDAINIDNRKCIKYIETNDIEFTYKEFEDDMGKLIKRFEEVGADFNDTINIELSPNSDYYKSFSIIIGDLKESYTKHLKLLNIIQSIY